MLFSSWLASFRSARRRLHRQRGILRRIELGSSAIEVERLETRTLLTFGTAAWTPQGPAPILYGQTEGLTASQDAVIGAVEAIAVHPTNSNKLVIGTVNGGLWTTDDALSAAPTWTPRTDQLGSLAIGAVAYSPINSNIVYAGTGSFSSGGSDGGPAIGVLKSTDSGVTWNQIGGTTLNDVRIRNIVPTSLLGGQVVLVGAYDVGGGIFRSTDGGATFSRLSGNGTSGLPANDFCTSLRADPSNPNRFFASTISFANVGNVWRSTDGGVTWTSISSGVGGLNGAGRVELAVHGTLTTNALYAAVISAASGKPTGIYRSTDFGVTWTAMDLPSTNESSGAVGTNPDGAPTAATDPGGQGELHFTIVADPSNKNLVYVGGDRQPGPGDGANFPNAIGAVNYTGRLFRGDASQPAGKQWVHLTHSNNKGPAGGGTANGTAPHADSRELVFDRTGQLLEGDDGGIYRRSSPTTNIGDWSAIIGNLSDTEFYSVAYDPLHGTIIGGTQDVGVPAQTQIGNLGWTDISQGDGGFVQVDATSTPGFSIRYYSYVGLQSFTRDTLDFNGNVTNSATIKLTVAGTSGKTIYQVDTLQFINPYVLNAVDATRMLIGTDTDIYESPDRGDNVKDLNVFTSTITAMAYGGKSGGVANPDVIYAAAGSTVELRTSKPGPFIPLTAYTGSGVNDIVLDPEDWKTAYFVDDSGHVWRTRDQGNSFTEITNNLASLTTDLRTIELFENAPSVLQDEVLYVGGAGGVFASIDQGTTWVNYGPNLPHSIVKDLRHDTTNNLLIAGTWGRGAWTAPIDQTPLDITLSASSIAENTSTPVTVGNIQLDDDGLGSNVLSITGGSDAAKFQLVGNQLQFKTGVQLNYEVKQNYSVQVTVTDGSLIFSKLLIINILDVNEVPTDIQLSNSAMSEQVGAANPLTAPLTVGDVTIVDDALGTNVLSIGGPDAGKFQIVNSQLQFKTGTTLDFETQSTFNIDLTSTDATGPGGPLVFTKSLTVQLTDVNEVPTDITLSNNTIPENTSTTNPLTVGALTIVDDALGSNALSITGGADASKFQLNGNALQFRAGTVLDFEAQATFLLDVTSTDTTGPGGPLTLTKTLTVQLSDVNEAAIAINLSPNSIAENTPTPVDVGTVSVINDALGTSALSSTLGGPDAASFQLVGNTLRFKSGVVLDRETKASYQVDFTAVDTNNTSIQSTKRVTVTILNVNESPTSVNDAIIVAEGATVTKLAGGTVNSVLSNDLDPDLLGGLDALTVTSYTPPSHSASFTLNADGTFLYKHDDSENFTDSFTYTITDIGGVFTSTATVNITITPVNDNAPIAVTDNINVDEGNQVTTVIGGATSLLTNDSDVDLPYDTLTVDTVAVTPPLYGTLTLFANGAFKYTHDGSETTSDSFQYRMRDAAGRTTVGTASITINPINDRPIPGPDLIELLENGTATTLANGATSVFNNDSDAESTSSQWTVQVVTQPQHGSVNLNPTTGMFSYTQNGDEVQYDSFVYELTDNGSPPGKAQATVTIRIKPVNDSTPVAVGDTIDVLQGGTATALKGGAVSVVKNDTDADLPFDSLSVPSYSQPLHGSLTMNADGSFVYTNDGKKFTTDSFTYQLKDAVGNPSASSGTVNISIKLINEKPTANPGGPYQIAPGDKLVLNGAGSSDPDHDQLTYYWDIKGDGIVDVVPVPTDPANTAEISWDKLVSLGVTSGTTTVKLEVRDPSGLSSFASTTLTIGSVYTFSPTADGIADDYVVSTINGVLDIRKVGTLTNLAAAGLTAITGVTIVGSSDDETFTVQSPSRSLAFTIDGNGGNDTVKVQGTAGADTLTVVSTGGPNSRLVVSKTTTIPFYVSATAETVAVLGGDGNDTLDARQVTAAIALLQLFGEGGSDTLTGGLGNDSFVGGDGTDLLAEVGPGNLVLTDTQLIGHGTDSVSTDIEAIKLTGDSNGNLLDASAFTRFGVLLDGADGNDTLLGGSKSDSLIGGNGIDEVRQAVSGDATLSNTQMTLGTSPNAVVDGLSGIEKVKLTGSATANKLNASTFTGSATLDGGAGNDTLTGGSGADLILGGADNDSLLGNAGNDTIGGGAGNDIIDGGDGDDGLAGQDGNDTIKGGAGNDTLLGQAGDDSLRGGAGRDLIQGGAGKDNIDGEGDVDTVIGGSGGGADKGDKIFDPFGEVIESFRFTVDWLSLI